MYFILCFSFITMNPESRKATSRNEIPDNLKLLFRPVAMMLPDKSMIAEVVLYSMGFTQARTLAKKIVETFQMCAEQLSNQFHYDYSMRAVKSVLSASAKLKLTNPEETNEDNIVLKAIFHVNLPQFVGDDVALFKGIVSDVFPKVSLPKMTRPVLKEALETTCKKNKLQPTPWFINKMIEFYEMIQVQHGIMVIGRPMSCKTQLYTILSETLTQLAETDKYDVNYTYHKAYFKIINPKSMTMHQLYGLFDPYTHEWSDGVLGSTFRDMATGSADERKWIVLDGPIDPSWIENLNTALDDSKKLCLMNGEIIHLSSWMNILFETDMLDRASPATVGRCGMIYMEDHALGWKPLMVSFLATLPKVSFLEEQIEFLEEMFDWLITSCLEFINSNCELFVCYSELHLFSCFLRLLKAMLNVDSMIENQNSETPIQVDTIQMQMTFLFCILWGMCSTVRGPSRPKFDSHFRNLVDGLIKGHAKPTGFKLGRTNMIPDSAQVFDYMIDNAKVGTWSKWIDQVSIVQGGGNSGLMGGADQYDEEVLIVPTAETVKQTFFLNLALTHGISLAMSGTSGTGKSFLTNRLEQVGSSCLC
jgi:dynein heavy chain